MIDYNAGAHILTLQKVKAKMPTKCKQLNSNKVEAFNPSITSDIYDSYLKYCTQTIKEDIQYLFDAISADTAKAQKVRAEVEVSGVKSGYNTASLELRDAHKVVSIRLLDENGTELCAKHEAFRLPTMNSAGIITMDSSLKVLINALQSSEGVSYDAGKQSMSLQCGYRSLSFTFTENGKLNLRTSAGSSGASVDEVIYGAMCLEGLSKEEAFEKFSVIHNAALVRESKINSDYYPSTGKKSANKVILMYNEPKFHLTDNARHILNKALQLDRALYETLARDVMLEDGEIIPRCTVITEKVLEKLKRNHVTLIYIRHRPALEGLCPVGQAVQAIPVVSPRTHLTPDMQRDLGTNQYYTHDEIVKEEGPDGFMSSFFAIPGMLIPELGGVIKGRLTPSHVDTLYNVQTGFEDYLYEMKKLLDDGLVSSAEERELIKSRLETYPYFIQNSYRLQRGKDKDYIFYTDVEVVTNGTFEGKYVPGGDKDKWYVRDAYGNFVEQSKMEKKVSWNQDGTDEFNIRGGEVLNYDDLLAMYSLLGWLRIEPHSDTVFNKDEMLLKRLSLANDVFSRCFRQAVDNVLSESNMAIRELVKQRNYPMGIPTTSLYYKIEKEWKSIMHREKYLTVADMKNPAATLAQVNNVTTISKNNEVADAQRLLYTAYYGRICPYETPASSKIGLANHKAVGCKINEKGELCAPYRKVIRSGNTCKLEGVMTMMTALQAKDFKIGDMLTLDYIDSNSEEPTFRNSRVLAIVPARAGSTEVTVFENIESFDLDYVLGFPEANISSTAKLIPFLGADDTARISFGLSMQKQAIYCLNNERPRVATHMYEDIWNYIPQYLHKAKYPGKIMRIDHNNIHVEYQVPTSQLTTDFTDKLIFRIPVSYDANSYIRTNYLEEAREGSFPGNVIPDYMYMNRVFSNGEYLVSRDENREFEGFKRLCPAYKVEFSCTIERVVRNDKNNTFEFHLKPVVTSGGTETISKSIYCPTITNIGPNIVFMHYDKLTGETFQKGDILAHATIAQDGVYAPARNVFVAYMPTGYNYEDAVDMSVECARKYTAVSIHTQEITTPLHTHDGEFAKETQRPNYVEPGEEFLTIQRKQTDGTTVSSDVKATTSGYYWESCNNGKRSCSNRTRNRIYKLLSFNQQQPGDKMAGRHGNKGVTARLCPNSKMPMFANGRTVDVCLNPCGVPSRMNIGQSLESYLGFVAYLLDIYIISDPFNGATNDEVAKLLKFVYDLSNEPDTNNWNSICSAAGLPIALAERAKQNESVLHEWAGCFNANGTARMYDPDTKRWFENPIAFGVSYFMKLEQEAEEKINQRDGMYSCDYVEMTQQPPRGKQRDGGQREGEMELVTLAGYGCTDYLYEAMNAKSDNVGERYNLMRTSIVDAKSINDSVRVNPRECTPRSVDVLRYLLEGIGIAIDTDDEDIPSIDINVSRHRKQYSRKNIDVHAADETEEIPDDFDSDEDYD